MPTPLGLNVHQLTPDAVAWCAANAVRAVRTTLYWALWEDRRYVADASTKLARAHDAGLDVLVCAHKVPDALARGDEWARRTEILSRYIEWLAGRARAWPWITWQPWNEGDVASFTRLFHGREPGELTPHARGVLYGMHLTALRAALGRDARLVTTGASGDAPAAFVDGVLTAYVGAPLTAVSVHAYGPPPATALAERAGAVRSAMARHSRGAPPLWCTEIGISDDAMRRVWRLAPGAWSARQADELARVATTALGASVARTYLYCYDRAEPSGYGIEGRLAAVWLSRHNRAVGGA